MSFILAALKKADSERRKKQGLSMDNLSEVQPGVDQPERSGARKMRPVMWILIGLIGVLGLIWQPGRNTSVVEPVVVEASNAAGLTERTLPAVNAPADRSGQDSVTPSLPEQLPVEGIVFIEDSPQSSRVFIGGRGYRVGDSFEEDVRVLSITASLVTLTNGTITRSYPIP